MTNGNAAETEHIGPITKEGSTETELNKDKHGDKRARKIPLQSTIACLVHACDKDEK